MQGSTDEDKAPLNEEELIQRAQRGDLRAYRILYEAYVGRVYALALRLLAERHAAEDVTQEVFIKVWKDIGNFRGDSRFFTWLHRICSLTTISYLRKQRGWMKRVLTGDSALPELVDTSPSQVDLDAYVQRLPERARIVFVLHAIEGYRHEDIADICNMAVGSSKAQFHRAKQLLQEWMSDD